MEWSYSKVGDTPFLPFNMEISTRFWMTYAAWQRKKRASNQARSHFRKEPVNLNADQSASENSRHVAVVVARSFASRPREVRLRARYRGILIHALFMPHRTNEIAEVDLQERCATAAGDLARFGDIEGRDERERELCEMINFWSRSRYTLDLIPYESWMYIFWSITIML